MADISQSVGQKGVNNPKDVLIVQKLINKNIFKLIPRRPLTVNGICDSNTISAIEDFQRRVVGMRQLDGRVDPKGRTIRFLSTGDQHTVAFEKNIANPIFNGKIRGTDCQGSGAYGASRGNRTHEGIDIVAKVGAQVCSPIDGTLTRKAYPYAKDLKYTGVLLTGTGKHKGYTIKIFYMNVWNEVIGQEVTMGETILGTVQDIAAKYPCQKGKMTNHIHVEVRKNGGLIDPTHIITWQSPTPSAWEKVFQSVVLPPYRF